MSKYLIKKEDSCQDCEATGEYKQNGLNKFQAHEFDRYKQYFKCPKCGGLGKTYQEVSLIEALEALEDLPIVLMRKA